MTVAQAQRNQTTEREGEHVRRERARTRERVDRSWLAFLTFLTAFLGHVLYIDIYVPMDV